MIEINRTSLEQLTAASPHTAALGLQLLDLGDGIETLIPYRADLVGDIKSGILAGGVITALLDHTCGLAVWQALGHYKTIATLDLRIDYLRGARPGQSVHAHAQCYKLTRSVAFVRATAFDGDRGDPIAAAQAAFMVNSDRRKGEGQ